MKFILKILKKTITKVILAVLFLIFVICAIVFWDAIIVQVHKLQGFYYIYKGDQAAQKIETQKAFDYYNKGLSLYPEHSMARCNLGSLYVLYEDYYKAIREYDQALSYTPKYIYCRMNYGVVLSEKLSDFDSAIEQYNQILDTKLPPFDVPYFFDKKKTGKYNKGLAHYNKGIAYRGKSLLAGEDTYESEQYLRMALEAYKNAVKILKKDYNAQYNYALTNHILGYTKIAEKAYCKAIEAEPLKYDAHYNLAILLMKEKLNVQAYEEIEKASILLDLDPEIDGNLARYVFDVMNEITKEVIIHDKTNYLVDRFEKDFKSTYGITYVRGKVVVAEEFDKAMMENFKTCSINKKPKKNKDDKKDKKGSKEK